MNLLSLQDTDCAQKKVLMRVDLNIALEQIEHETESFRLTLIKESVEYILSFPGTTLTLLSHFGRPEGKINEDFSLRKVHPLLETVLNQPVEFVDDCLKKPNFENTRITLLENVRFYPEEEQNDTAFAEKLAEGYDLYVNEAFSNSHRAHASMEAITRYLPAVAGIHLVQEVNALEEALEQPKRPAIAVLGGDKIETKLPLIRALEAKYDSVLLGGKIANEAIDEGIVFSSKVLLPTDFRGEERFDIGDQTANRYAEIILQAKTILWNGPLGKFEEAPFDEGTKKIAEALATTEGYVVAGGGESLAVIEDTGIAKSIDLISSGGGAMLSFLAGEPMPALAVLREQ